MKKDEPPLRSTERWAHFRFSVIGSLLAAPPCRGQLQAQLQELAARKWRHPFSGDWVLLGCSTIERWYYQALGSRVGPVEALKRKIRSDHGLHPSLSHRLIELLTEQHRQHPGWSYQLHADNLAVLAEQQPQAGPMPSYGSVWRYMKSHGLFKGARELCHGLSQAFQKRDLPRSLLYDNGSAMIASETEQGLTRLGVLFENTLPYSP